jgi:hypothetical protein
LTLATLMALGLTSMGEPLVIVDYVAPPECATLAVFQQLVRAELAREADPNRTWRIAVTIRHEAEFIGTLDTGSGTREIHASTCDEITAALVTIVAMAPPPVPKTPLLPEPATRLVPPVPMAPAAMLHSSPRLASPTLLGIGVATAAVGIAAALFGIFRLVAAPTTTEVCPLAAACPGSGPDALSIASVAAGAGFAAGGLVMSILGLRRTPLSVAGGPTGSLGVSARVTF